MQYNIDNLKKTLNLMDSLGYLDNISNPEEQFEFVKNKVPTIPTSFYAELRKMLGDMRRDKHNSLKNNKMEAAFKHADNIISDNELLKADKSILNDEFAQSYDTIVSVMNNLKDKDLSREERKVLIHSFSAIGGKIEGETITRLPKSFKDMQEVISGNEPITSVHRAEMKKLATLFENTKVQTIKEIAARDGRSGKMGIEKSYTASM